MTERRAAGVLCLPLLLYCLPLRHHHITDQRNRGGASVYDEGARWSPRSLSHCETKVINLPVLLLQSTGRQLIPFISFWVVLSPKPAACNFSAKWLFFFWQIGIWYNQKYMEMGALPIYNRIFPAPGKFQNGNIFLIWLRAMVQHKAILERQLPDKLKMAIAKQIENNLFSKASACFLPVTLLNQNTFVYLRWIR